MDGPQASFGMTSTIAGFAMKAKRPLFLHGGPGIGKTAVPHLLAAEEQISCEVLTVPQLEPVDFRGIPYINDGQTEWAPPWFLRPKTPRGILALDEMTSAVPSVQVVCFQLLLENRIGEFHLPPGWWVMGMGNRAIDNSVVYDLPAPLRNRMLQIHFTPHPDEWLAWAKANAIHPTVQDFLAKHPSYIYNEADTKQEAFPSPRSWHMLSDVLKAGADQSPTHAELCAFSTVGVSAGKLYLDSIRGKPRITAQQIRQNAKGIEIPPPTELSLVLRDLARTATKDTMFQDVPFLSRLNKDYHAQFLAALPTDDLRAKYKEWL